MVQAALRLCAAGLPCAPGRLCRAAGLRIRLRSRRCGSEPSISSSCIDPRLKTMRPVTIVDIDEKSLADPKLGQWPWPRTRIADIITNLTRLGAVVIAFDAVFSEPDRLNPDVAADTFGNLDEETRAKIAGAAEQRPGFSPMPSAIRAWCWANPVCPNVRADLDKKLPVTGLAMLGEEPQPFMFQFPGAAAQRARAGGGGGRARPVHHQARARRHRPPRADDHDGPGHHHAVAELRDVADRERLRHDPDQGRQGRHPEHRRQGFRRSRPTATASSGCIMRAAIPRSMSRPSMCSKAASRRTGSRASWC